MVCSRCKTDKDAEAYYASTLRSKDRRGMWCKACRKEYLASPEMRAKWTVLQRESRARKRARVSALKSSQGCADCGESHPACLDFHHLDPSQKEHNVVRLVDSNAGWERIKGEAAKCVVLCANCHRKRHFNEREAVKAIAKEA